VTPTSYLELLSTFRRVLVQKKDELETGKRRLSVGLDKLEHTEKAVEIMQVELTDLKPVLQRTSVEVDELMVKIEKDKASAAETKAIVEAEKDIASAKEAECKSIKDDAEAGLAEALPALDEAVKVLQNLKASDISEVAKYANPPALVKLVIEALCVMFQIAPAKVGEAGKKVDDYWQPGKKLLGDKDLINNMFNYDKDHIPDKVIKKIEVYVHNENFKPEKIESVSKACTAMCQVCMYVCMLCALWICMSR
jgi:dynein heavy chain